MCLCSVFRQAWLGSLNEMFEANNYLGELKGYFRLHDSVRSEISYQQKYNLTMCAKFRHSQVNNFSLAVNKLI